MTRLSELLASDWSATAFHSMLSFLTHNQIIYTNQTNVLHTVLFI